MGWIVEWVVEVVMQGIAWVMIWMARKMQNTFSLNGKDTLKLFFQTFSGDTSGTNAGFLGQVYKLFLILAFAIIFLNMIYQLFKALFGPLAQAESPSRVIIKSVFFALLTAFTQSIVALVFEITTIPYKILTSTKVGVGNQLYGLTPDVFKISDNETFGASDLLVDVAIFQSVIAIVLFFMLLKQFFATSLELAERYLMLGLLTIIGPLCIACGATKGLEDVFRNWISWLVNGCIVMIFSTFFIAVFINTFQASTEFISLLLWIAWFKTAQKIDDHMNALGLKTAKTGGFGLDVINAMQNGLPSAMMAANKITGKNMGIPFAGFMGMKHNGQVNPADGGILTTLGMGDPAKGQNMLKTQNVSKMLNAAGNRFNSEGLKKAASGLEKRTEDANNLIKKANRAVSNAGQSAKEALFHDGKKMHGSRSGKSHEELLNWASGKNGASMPPKNTEAYQDACKDIMALKAGEGNVKSLEEKGFKFQDMHYNPQTGDLTFSATNGQDVTCSGKITSGHSAEEGYIPVMGENGEEMGCKVQVHGPEDVPLEHPIVNTVNPEDNRDIVSSENMEEAGDFAQPKTGADASVNQEALENANMSDEDKEAVKNLMDENNGQLPISENEIIRDEENPEEMSLKTYDENGNEDENGDFVKVDDGSEEGLLVPQSILENDADNNDDSNIQIDDRDTEINQIEAAETGEMIPEENVEKGADGEAESVQIGDKNYDVESMDGDVMHCVNPEDETDTVDLVKGEDGNLYQVPQSEEGENIEAGNVEETPNSVTVGDTEYNLGEPDENGVMTGTAEDGTEKQFVANEDGSLSEVSETVGADNVSVAEDGTKTLSSSDNGELTLSSEKDADGNYTATNEAGESFKVKENEDGSMSVLASSEEKVGAENISEQDAPRTMSTENHGELTLSSEKDADGNYTATNEAGENFKVKENEDGSMSVMASSEAERIQSNEISEKDGERTISTAQGEMTLSSEKDADGNYTATNEAGESFKVKENEDGSMSLMTSNESERVDAKNISEPSKETHLNSESHGDLTLSSEKDADGNYTATNEKGESFKVKENEDGSMSVISTNKAEANSTTTVTDNDGNKYTLDKSNQDSNSNIVKGTDEKGNEAYFQQNKDGSMTKLPEGEKVSSANSIEATTDDNKTYKMSQPDANGLMQGSTHDGSGDHGTFIKEANGDISRVESSTVGVQNLDTANNKLTVNEKDGKEAEYSLSKPDANGYMTGTTASGETARFKVSEDGKTAEKLETKETISASNVKESTTATDSAKNDYNIGKTNSNGIAIGTDKNTGEAVAFRDNGDGSYSKLNKAEKIDNAKISTSANPTSITDANNNKYENIRKNDDGTFTGTTKNGDTATFSKTDSGFQKMSEAKQVDSSKGIQKEMQQMASQRQTGDTYSVTDKNGVQFDNIQKQSNGSYVGYNSQTGEKASFSMGSNGKLERESYMATDKAGNKFEVSSKSLSDSVKDTSGKVQHLDTSAPVTKNADGTVTTKNTRGENVTIPASHVNDDGKGNISINTTKSANFSTAETGTNGASYNINANSAKVNFAAGADGNGQMKLTGIDSKTGNTVGLKNDNATMTVTNASGSQSEMKLNQNFKYDAKSNTYTGSDINGNSVSFSGDSLKSAQVNTGNGFNTMENRTYSPKLTERPQPENTSMLVKSTSGEYVKPDNFQRYNDHGQKDNNGSFIHVNGKPVAVETNTNGSISAYRYNERAASMSAVKKDSNGIYQPITQDAPGVTHTYRPASNNERTTHMMNEGKTYETVGGFQTDKNGSYRPQTKVTGTDNQEYSVVTNAHGFSEKNVPIPYERDGKQYLQVYDPSDSSKTKEIEVSSLKHSKKDGFSVYAEYKDTYNNTTTVQRINLRDAKGVANAVQDATYYNGVNMNIDLNRASIVDIPYGAKRPDGQPQTVTGSKMISFEGEQYIAHKIGSADITGCKGATMEINGAHYFVEPVGSNETSRDLNNIGYRDSSNKIMVISDSDKSRPEVKAMLKKLNIPLNSKNIKVRNDGNGSWDITYSDGKKNMAITSTPRQNANNHQQHHNASGKVAGFAYELKNNEKVGNLKNPVSMSGIKKLATTFIFKKNK